MEPNTDEVELMRTDDIKLHDLIYDIAHAMDGWAANIKYPENTHGADLVHGETGATIHIHHTAYLGKLEISGCFPRNESDQAMSANSWGLVGYGERDPHIGCSPRRKGAAIAKEIERRLLPKYMPMYEKAKEKRAARLAYIEKRDSVTERYARRLGGTARDGAVHVSCTKHDNWGDVTVNEDGGGRIDMHLEPDVMVRVVRLIGEYTKR